MGLLHAPRLYSRAEHLSDAVVHALGLIAAVSAVPVLITLTVLWRGDGAAIVGVSVYGATLIAMLTFSALYNGLYESRWSHVLRRLDHAAIYLKIAGTYTPFTLLSGGYGSGLLAGLWAAALAGTGLKVYSPTRFRWLALALYLGMGWAGVFVGWDLFATLSPGVLPLIAAGGLLYTAGVFFFLFNRLPFHNTIWHAFVLAASVVFFAAVARQMADSTMALAAAH